jgi:ankyrin repeat protein
MAMLSFLLAVGKNPNSRDIYGITPLQIAAWNKQSKAVQKLCKSNIDVNIADRMGHTALFKAVWKNCMKSTQTLLKAGADFDLQDNCGNTALMLAADFGFKDSLLLLLASGANVNKQNQWGETALFIAISQENLCCVQHLLDFNANPNLCNFDGCSPLFALARKSLTMINYQMLCALMPANPNLDIKGSDAETLNGARMSPLKVALLQENFLLADILVTLGANTNFLLSEPVTSLIRRPNWRKHFCKLAAAPRSLADSCRLTIRSSVRCENAHSLQDLALCGLPPSLVKFVAMSDLPSSRGAYVQSRSSVLAGLEIRLLAD